MRELDKWLYISTDILAFVVLIFLFLVVLFCFPEIQTAIERFTTFLK